jgi:hypothetical protein|tara:strand:- start:86 stop:505 length:420 start_codon:yes stop_codon:yes gene_type:complete
MKRIILVLVVILISTNILHAANFKWLKIVTSDDDTGVLYVDKKTVFRVGSYKYFWLLTDSIAPSDDDSYKSIITHMMANCSTYESRAITFTSFTENMGKGEIDLDFIVPEEDISYFKWRKYDLKKTVHGFVLQKVCNRM